MRASRPTASPSVRSQKVADFLGNCSAGGSVGACAADMTAQATVRGLAVAVLDTYPRLDGFPDAARMSAAARSVRARSRPVMPTRAPIVASPIAVALSIPPVAPVIRTTLPAIGSVPAVTSFLDGDDNGSSSMPFSDMTDRLVGPPEPLVRDAAA